MKLTAKQIQEVRARMLMVQKGVCPLCQEIIQPESATLDHDHKTGRVRNVLCRNCNAMEGRVFAAATRAKRGGTARDWLARMVEYITRHQDAPGPMIHPLHRTAEEKKLLSKKRRTKKRCQMQMKLLQSKQS